jgi:hypothetical protein
MEDMKAKNKAMYIYCNYLVRIEHWELYHAVEAGVPLFGMRSSNIAES